MSNEHYHPLPELISNELIERAAKLSPALLCDGMQKLGIPRNGCMNSSLLPIDDNKVMIGTACTVDTLEGDNFPIHLAIYQCQPGYIIVIAGKGYQDRAYIGELMAGAADAIGVNGIIVDGYVRDKNGLKTLSIPIYANGFMPRTPSKSGPGKINTPVECAGVQVSPGDLIVGDCDGVAVIPRERIEEVLYAAEEKLAYEVKRQKAISEHKNCRLNGEVGMDLTPKWVLDMMDKS